jgi:general secretion pathway protein G
MSDALASDMKIYKSKSWLNNSVRRRGFTLIELLLVLVILAILAAIVVPNFVDRAEKARQTAAKVQVSTFVTALSTFEVDNGYFPKGPDGLQLLMTRPRDDQNNWKGPYLQTDKLPLDPWQHPYVYEIPGKHNPSSFDVYSKGKNGQAGSESIGNWTSY